MSGALPAVLYKYLPLRFARTMIDEGALMFSTLSWFQNLEDPDRGDGFEGTHKYFPVGGLEVTKTHCAGRLLRAPEKFSLPSDSLQSKAAGRDHIFIYSTSTKCDLTQFDDPHEPSACVEIHDPSKFLARLRTTLRRWSSTRATTLIHDQMSYWSPADPPGNVYALPDRLTMNKHDEFREQHEYRFAFGTKPNVFDFEYVEMSIVREGSKNPRPVLDERQHRLLIRVGPLGDCCRLI